jgi:outer membrane protein OmpA-like peptidoglycan-associated protein
MNINKILFSLVIILCTVGFLQAQQTSKSKSKSKLYEKGLQNKNVKIRNEKALNSPNTDYSPTYYQNGLVYVSSRNNKGPQDKKSGETYFELYFSPFDPAGDPTTPTSFSLEVNSALHEGPVTFSHNYKTMYFTRNNMDKGQRKADKNGVVRLKIYESQRGKYDWSEIKELPFNNDGYSCMHPSLSLDGKTLYFASDMPGGFGRYDLYESTRDQNGWSKPRNLGKEVNTEKDEVFPYIHSNGTLFFSSDGHNSIGGLDLFFSVIKGSDFTEVINLGEPFNSLNDDLGIIMNEDASKGFFSSNRSPSFGSDDIYSFEVSQGIEGVGKPVTQRGTIVVVDGKTGKPIQGASIRILEPSDEGFISGTDANDFYDIDLQPLNEQGNSLSLNIVRKNADRLGKPTDYSNAVGEAFYDFMQYRTYLVLASANGYKTGERFFSVEPNDEGIVKIKMEDAPNCVNAFGTIATDGVGARISNARIRFTNKTTKKEVAARTNLNGEWDVCLPGDGEYTMSVDKEGFNAENVNFSAIKTKSNFKEVRLISATMASTTTQSAAPTPGFAEEPVHVGEEIIMDKIYYDYNKSTLNENATKHLDELCKLMLRYPKMEIDLISHTDSRGDAKINLKLSEERASNAKKYMVFRKVEASRINAVGKGDTEPRNNCKRGANCKEEEYKFNRRTEVKVRKM